MSESSSASQSARTSPGVKPVNAFSATQAQISAATVTAVMAYSNLQKLTGSQHNSPRTIPRPSTPNLGMPSSTGTGEILSADPNSPRMLQAYLEKRIEEALGQVAEANQSVAHLVSKNRALEKEVTALRAQKETKDTGTQTDVVDCSTPEDDIEV
jgi:hypothetical protein